MNVSDNSTWKWNFECEKWETGGTHGLACCLPCGWTLSMVTWRSDDKEDARDGSQLGETADHLSPLVAPFSTMKGKLMIYLSGYDYCAQRRKVYKRNQPLFYLDQDPVHKLEVGADTANKFKNIWLAGWWDIEEAYSC